MTLKIYLHRNMNLNKYLLKYQFSKLKDSDSVFKKFIYCIFQVLHYNILNLNLSQVNFNKKSFSNFNSLIYYS